MPTTTRNKRKHQQSELEEKLLRCARRGDFERARELVEIERVNVNFSDEYGITPLICAAFNEYARVVRFLLENDANVDAADRDGRTALVCAVIRGNVALAQLLLQYGSHVEEQFRFGGDMYSPLGWAIETKDVGMVVLLLRFGANTLETLCCGFERSGLFLACWLGNVEIVRLLLNHDDDVDVNTFAPRNNDDPALSPLCQACKRNSMETGDGTHPLSPLEAAIERNKLEVAQLLLDRGARVNDRPLLWQCASWTAESHTWNVRVYGISNRLEIARFLLRAGANVNLADRESGETPLWKAAKNGDVKLVKELLKARADVCIRDNKGETPLGVAYRQGHKGVVYLLLRTSPHVWSNLAEIW